MVANRVRAAIIAGAVALAIVGAAFALPAPGEERLSVKLSFVASRTVLGKYDIAFASLEAKPMTLLVWDSVLYNDWANKFCLLCVKDHTAIVSLSAAGIGHKQVEANVGDFPLLGRGERGFTVVLLDVPPGEYAVSATLYNAGGVEKASYSNTIQLYRR